MKAEIVPLQSNKSLFGKEGLMQMQEVTEDKTILTLDYCVT